MTDYRQSNFGSGEISPSLWGSDHLREYSGGARAARNFVVSKYRTLVNRPGTIFLHEVKDSTKLTRLIPFKFSSGQSYAIEAGDLNFRITKNDGSQLLAEGLIALGSASARQRSVDKGATWTTPTALPATSYRGSCQAANGRFVAVGGVSDAVVSDDGGQTWSARVLPASIGSWRDVSFNGRMLIAVAFGGEMAYSLDNGDTWSLVPSPPSGTFDKEDIAWGLDRWIMVGSGPAGTARYSYSFDGLAWSDTTAIGNLDSLYTSSSLRGVCVLNGQFLAVGFASNDGGVTKQLLWCTIGILSANWRLGVIGANLGEFYGVATNGEIVLAVGQNTAVNAPRAYKYDPILDTWADTSPSAGGVFWDAVYSRGFFVVAGTNRISRYDGTAWTAEPTVAAGTYLTVGTGKGTETLEVTTPYPDSEVRNLMTAQSGDIVTLFRQTFAPRELRRYSEHDWRLVGWYKAPPTRKVTGLAFSPSANQTEDQTHVTQPWQVVVTWEDEQTGIESLPSDALVAGGSGKFLVYPDKPQTYTWNVVEKARRYHVYRGQNGEWGWIGSAKQPTIPAGVSPTTVSFMDMGQVPIYSESPPTWDNPFRSDLSYPACGCYLDERLVVAGSIVQPGTVKGSKVADYYNFDEPLIPGDNSAWEFTLATREFEEARWIVPLEFLVIGTSESEWVMAGSSSGGSITGTSVFARAKAQRPCARIQPIVVGNGIVYIQDGAQVVRYFKPTRDLLTEADPAVFGGLELSVFSQHLLEGYSIVDMAYAQSPDSTLWIVRSDGALLSLTFIPEHGVWGWARHDSGGDAFEAVTVIPDGTRDVPFFVVKRSINGTTKRYVEMLATRSPASVSVGVFLDCSKTQTIAAGNTVSGLTHLEGRTVGVLADGTYRGTYTVSSGAVTFTGPAATTVTVGLGITADFESLDFPAGRTRQKQVARVSLEYRLNPSFSDADPVPSGVVATGVAFGPDASNLSDIRKFSDARDGVLTVPIDRATNPGGRCFLRHTQPLPIEIKGITREVTG